LDRHISGADQLPADFRACDWSQSHGMPTVVFYDELITVDSLKTLHDYFRQQSCDIENIIVVTSHGVGVADWWRHYVALHQQRSFAIQEWLFVRSMRWQQYFQDFRMPDRSQLDKNITRFFNSYSGANARLDRQYLGLKLRGLGDIGVVDMLCDFTTTKSQLLSHAYYLGYFKDSLEEATIQSLYDQFVQDSRLILDPMIGNIQEPKVRPTQFGQGWQYQLDRQCLATVINETNNIEPWGMVSEKTLRPFLHHCAVIHTGYQCTRQLEDMGFWFPHDIFDYSYQKEPDWLVRVNGMIASIESTHNKMAHRYQEYWDDNYQNFRHNALLLEQYFRGDPAL